MDCKLKICELMKDLKTCKIKFIEQELMWYGADKAEIIESLKVLQERGVIYRKKGGVLELTEPLKS
ncbi:MAG: hypothetical protein KKD39_00055 [Candidatus Altiarchaeota archaeon]|nr:hypothetical protein [Candidatus Altiarchaeota archaeon]